MGDSTSVDSKGLALPRNCAGLPGFCLYRRKAIQLEGQDVSSKKKNGSRSCRFPGIFLKRIVTWEGNLFKKQIGLKTKTLPERPQTSRQGQGRLGPAPQFAPWAIAKTGDEIDAQPLQLQRVRSRATGAWR